MIMNNDQKGTELDRILSETEILPSSGFTASVIIATIVQLSHGMPETPASPAWHTALHSIEETTLRLGGQWVALALLASLACMKFAALFVPRRA